MNDKDKKHFGELMAVMAEVFQKDVSKPLMKIYFEALKQYPIEAIDAGVSKIIATRTITGTIPLPAEIINAIEGSQDEKAELAWSVLVWTIERVGHMASIKFEDPKIHDVVQTMGGWLRVCSADDNVYNEEWHTKNMQWRKKDFISLYKAIQGSNVEYLPGLQEVENKGKFDDYVPAITYVGGQPGRYLALPMAEVKLINHAQEVG